MESPIWCFKMNCEKKKEEIRHKVKQTLVIGNKTWDLLEVEVILSKKEEK